MEINLTTMHIVYFLVTFLPVIVSSWASPFLRGHFLVQVRVFVRVCVFSCVFAWTRACFRFFFYKFPAQFKACTKLAK